ncbi:hypothetical protein ACJX0J_014793, partial [Zea mays]
FIIAYVSSFPNLWAFTKSSLLPGANLCHKDRTIYCALTTTRIRRGLHHIIYLHFAST